LESPDVDPTLATADNTEKEKLSDIAQLYDNAIAEIARTKEAINENDINIGLSEIEAKYAPVAETEVETEVDVDMGDGVSEGASRSTCYGHRRSY
jgi:flagellin-specific chaperone FliS